MATGNRTVVILGAVFLAAVIVAIVIFFMVPAGDTPGTEQSDTTTAPVLDGAPAATGASTGFDLGVLNRRVYQLLNRQLVQEGAIPVPPPPAVGKPNPFL